MKKLKKQVTKALGFVSSRLSIVPYSIFLVGRNTLRFVAGGIAVAILTPIATLESGFADTKKDLKSWVNYRLSWRYKLSRTATNARKLIVKSIL